MFQKGYDDRLFSGGLREKIHLQRFEWLRLQTKGLSGSLIEIGCFNARSLQYISFVPDKYLGLDAGWEGGLDEAQTKYPQYSFKKSTDPMDIDGNWSVSIALETLEHIPRPEILENYIKNLSLKSKLIIATVPNEIGIIFIIKYMYKLFVYKDKGKYSFLELLNQFFGMSHLVRQDEHHGFDYRSLIKIMDKYFFIDKIEGINNNLPIFLNTQIGIVARSKLNAIQY
jgi:hypothetical protein